MKDRETGAIYAFLDRGAELGSGAAPGADCPCCTDCFLLSVWEHGRAADMDIL